LNRPIEALTRNTNQRRSMSALACCHQKRIEVPDNETLRQFAVNIQQKTNVEEQKNFARIERLVQFVKAAAPNAPIQLGR
jgi:hypothetical protein